MKTIFNKILFAIMSVSVCFSVISCDDETGEETDTNQSEVVFPSDVNLTKIN